MRTMRYEWLSYTPSPAPLVTFEKIWYDNNIIMMAAVDGRSALEDVFSVSLVFPSSLLVLVMS